MKSFKLPKNFKKVTPLSKTLALILFIILPFLGFYLGLSWPKTQEVAFTPSRPDEVTEEFYNLYLNCVKVKGTSCEWRNSSYVDKSLSDNLQRKKINLTCSTNTPLGTVSKLVSADPKQAIVDSYQVYETSVVKVTVSLKYLDDSWRISDINCQH